MRQVFSSRRLENVERVAALMRAAGIEIYIANGRSYKGQRRRQFTYRDHLNHDPEAAIWVLKAGDQPQARQILREAGLLESTRDHTGAFIGLPEPSGPAKAPGSAWALRMRVIVFLLAGAVSVMMWMRLG